MKYRAEIDGLRALAVLPVILFHAGFDWFRGGFVGVDVFFVISGYLITTIIASELAEGKFSILDFYERRARRILPALFFVMLVCVPFAWLWLRPDDLKDFGQSLVAVTTFSANIFFWLESGYFTSAAELKPLLHTWSLSLEEQYYILFPILLILTWRLGVRWIVILFSVLFAASLAFSHWGAYYQPDSTFYILPTRVWELLLGVFMAFYMEKRGPSGSAVANQMLSVLGLGMIISAVFLFDERTPFPGLYALAPTVGTALLILSAVPNTFVHRALSLRPIVGAGLVSYSAYLWHQPMLAFAHHRAVEQVPAYVLFLICLLAFPVGYLSWRFIEVPFRDSARVSKRMFMVSATALATLFVLTGLIFHFGKGFTTRFYAEDLYGVLTSEQRGQCHFNNRNYSNKACVYFSDNPSWATFGDSHSVEVSEALAAVLERTGQGVQQNTFSGCIPVIGAVPDFPCSVWSAKTIKAILENRDIEHVIVSYRLSAYVNGEHLDDYERQEKTFRQDELWHDLLDILKAFAAAKKSVYLILQTPELPTDIFKLKKYSDVRVNGNLIGVSRAWWDERMAFVYANLDDIPESVVVFDPSDIFCDAAHCFASKGERLMYFDSHHPSVFGATEVIAEMDRRFGMFDH